MIVYFFVALAILSAAAGLFGQAGLEVDGKRYALRKYFKFLGLTFGRWQALPRVKAVVLKYFSTITRDTPGTLGSLARWNNNATGNAQVTILLSVEGMRNGIVLRSVPLGELSTARSFAEETANELGVPVLEFLPDS